MVVKSFHHILFWFKWFYATDFHYIKQNLHLSLENKHQISLQVLFVTSKFSSCTVIPACTSSN